MNETPTQINGSAPKGIKSFLRYIQWRISSSQYSYLFYAFLIPLALMYLIYLSMGIHPFGNGSVLVLDLNGQYVYFFESLRNAVCGDGSFLYTFSRALGGEYMGMYAYYLASPLSSLVCLFPAARILEALLTIILIKTGLCGLTFGFYLHKHSKNPNRIMVVAFSVMYALCSFAVVHQNNVMWTDAIIWLPIIAYSIEQLITNGKYKLFIISLALTMMSNYYIGYMVCIFCVVYFFYYHLAYGKEICNPFSKRLNALRSFVRFAASALIAAAIAAFIILAAYYSLTFGKNEFSDPNWSLKAKFDILDFFTKFLPGTYDTVRPEGLPFVYCGILVLIAVPVYFTSKSIKIREKMASLGLVFFFMLCFIASPLDLIWHGFQNPNWLNHRYSFMLCFILLVLAYKGFGNLRRCNEKFILAVSAFIVLFVAICQKMTFDTYVVSDEKIQTFQTVWLTVIVTVVLFAVLCVLMRTNNPKNREGITAILASVICIEIFCNALAMVVQFDDDVVYSSYNGYNSFISELRPVVEELKEYDSSFYRMEKTVHRKNNDNMALGIRGLSNSTSTLNSSTIKFLNNMGYTSRSHLSKYLGGTPVNDSLLGLKYVIDQKDSTALVNYYDEEFSNGKYTVYQNPYALSVAYESSRDVLDFDFEKYKTQFQKLNGVVSAIAGYESDVQLFKPVSDVEETYSGCTLSGSYISKTFMKTKENGAASVSYSFIAGASAEYYFHTPSNSPKECLLEVNGEGLGKYLGSDTRHIFSIGWFEKGEKVTVTIQLKDDPLNLIGGLNYVWYLDEDLYNKTFAELNQKPQWQIDDHSHDHLSGSLYTQKTDTMIMTTIPYDEGWQVYVDDERVEIYQALDALIAFDVEGEGEHTVEMKYMPRIYKIGMIVSVTGTFTFVAICAVDIILRKLRNDKNTPAVENYWILEDFDEDQIQLSEFTIEAKPKKKLIDNLKNILKKDKDK